MRKHLRKHDLHKHGRFKKELWTAAVAVWCWLAIVLIGLLCSCNANGASPNPSRDFRAVVCRVSNQHQNASDIGSGTLIDKTSDGREGLVLTCAHLFRDGAGEIVVSFVDGKSHRAKLIAMDQQADLAALAIASPQGEPAKIALESNAAGRLHACGFGPRGIYRCAVGSTVGQAASAGQMSLLIGNPVRSGDSGGGVFDGQDRLVAVIWGEAQGVTYASYGAPLRRFLSRVLKPKTSAVSSCPNGYCPPSPARPLLPRSQKPSSVDPRWMDFQRQLEELRNQKQDRGDYLTRAELPDVEKFVQRHEVEKLSDETEGRHASLLERLQILDGRTVGKAAGTAAVGLLGLSGPAGWAVIAGASVGGWLLGRQVRRRVKRQVRSAGGRRRRRFRRKE